MQSPKRNEKKIGPLIDYIDNFLLLFVTEVVADFGEIEIFTGPAAVDIEYVEACRLEMGRGVVRFRDEDLRVLSILFGTVKIADRQKP